MQEKDVSQKSKELRLLDAASARVKKENTERQKRKWKRRNRSRE